MVSISWRVWRQVPTGLTTGQLPTWANEYAPDWSRKSKLLFAYSLRRSYDVRLIAEAGQSLGRQRDCTLHLGVGPIPTGTKCSAPRPRISATALWITSRWSAKCSDSGRVLTGSWRRSSIGQMSFRNLYVPSQLPSKEEKGLPCSHQFSAAAPPGSARRPDVISSPHRIYPHARAEGSYPQLIPT